MTEKTEVREKLFLNSFLNHYCMLMMGYKWNIKDKVYVNKDKEVFDINTMDWTDYEFINIETEIPHENDHIDGILFFGDGTIEFHLKESQEALNWAEFDTHTIRLVIVQLSKQIGLFYPFCFLPKH